MRSVGQLVALSAVDILVLCGLVLGGDYKLTYNVRVPVAEAMASGRTVFVYVTQAHTWNEASDICRTLYSSQGGTLAKVDSQESHQVVVALLQNYSNGVWFGLHNVGSIDKQPKFMWSDARCSDFDFGNLAKFKPDEIGDTQTRCYFLADKGLTWIKGKCSETRHFICQYQDVSNSTCEAPGSSSTPGNAYKMVRARFFSLETYNASLAACSSECTNMAGCFLTSPGSSTCLMGVVDGSASSLVKTGCVIGTSLSTLYTSYGTNTSDYPASCVPTNTSDLNSNTNYSGERTTTRAPTDPCPTATRTITLMTTQTRSTTVTLMTTQTRPTTITATTTVIRTSPVVQTPSTCVVPSSDLARQDVGATPGRPVTMTTTTTYVTTKLQSTTVTVTATTTIPSSQQVPQSLSPCVVSESTSMASGDSSQSTTVSYLTTIQPSISTKTSVTSFMKTPSLIRPTSSSNFSAATFLTRPHLSSDTAAATSSLSPQSSSDTAAAGSSLSPHSGSNPVAATSSLSPQSSSDTVTATSSLSPQSSSDTAAATSSFSPQSSSDTAAAGSSLSPHSGSNPAAATSSLNPQSSSDTAAATSSLSPHPGSKPAAAMSSSLHSSSDLTASAALNVQSASSLCPDCSRSTTQVPGVEVVASSCPLCPDCTCSTTQAPGVEVVASSCVTPRLTVTVMRCSSSSTSRPTMMTSLTTPMLTVTTAAGHQELTGQDMPTMRHTAHTDVRTDSLTHVSPTGIASSYQTRTSGTPSATLTWSHTLHANGLSHLASHAAATSHDPDISDMTSAIVSDLLLNQRELSKSRRTRESAPDARLSAQISGGVAVLILCAVLSCVLILDSPRMRVCVKDTFVALKT